MRAEDASLGVAYLFGLIDHNLGDWSQYVVALKGKVIKRIASLWTILDMELQLPKMSFFWSLTYKPLILNTVTDKNQQKMQ